MRTTCWPHRIVLMAKTWHSWNGSCRPFVWVNGTPRKMLIVRKKTTVLIQLLMCPLLRESHTNCMCPHRKLKRMTSHYFVWAGRLSLPIGFGQFACLLRRTCDRRITTISHWPSPAGAKQRLVCDSSSSFRQPVYLLHSFFSFFSSLEQWSIVEGQRERIPVGALQQRLSRTQCRSWTNTTMCRRR